MTSGKTYEISLQKRIATIVQTYGGMRPAARALGIDYSYLRCLMIGEKSNPSDEVLQILGLRRIIDIKYVFDENNDATTNKKTEASNVMPRLI